ncbi:hypothetical protein ES705_35274 [subsurface metagenome]
MLSLRKDYLMFENHIIGNYYPEKGYYHKCAFPKCDDPYFFGRKNKLYLGNDSIETIAKLFDINEENVVDAIEFHKAA